MSSELHIVERELEDLRARVESEPDRDRESALIEKLFELLSKQQQEENAA